MTDGTASPHQNTGQSGDVLQEILSKLNVLLDAASIITAEPQPVAQKVYDCKIIKDTQEFHFENLWSDGWTCVHTQFALDGKVQTIWQKRNEPAKKEDIADKAQEYIETIGDASELEVDDDNPASIETTEPEIEVIEIKADIIRIADKGFAPPGGFGKYSAALLEHGIDRTREAMDAEVTLAGVRATRPADEPPITRFLPLSQIEEA